MGEGAVDGRARMGGDYTQGLAAEIFDRVAQGGDGITPAQFRVSMVELFGYVPSPMDVEAAFMGHAGGPTATSARCGAGAHLAARMQPWTVRASWA